MNIVEYAEKYVADRGLARNPVHSASRFFRLVGDVPVTDVSEDNLRQFRAAMEKQKLAAETIRGSLKDMRTLVRSSGRDVVIDRVRQDDPNPQPVALRDIDAIWPHLATWSRQWLVIAFWTCLRAADSIRMQKAIATMPAGRLEWKARKTGHRHRWPVPEWMKEHLEPVTLPYSATDDWCKVIVRAELQRACKLAEIDKISPLQIRDTGLQQWARADYHVSKVLHGCQLGVIGRYVDPLDIIEPVSHRVKLPASFGAIRQESDDLTGMILKLDPEARRMVSEMTLRLAR
jgi:hypothetical protein